MVAILAIFLKSTCLKDKSFFFFFFTSNSSEHVNRALITEREELLSFQVPTGR